MSYTFVSYSDTVIKVTENGNEILYKKVYCTTSVDGDYFNFFAHELETGKLRQQYSLLYTDCTNPLEASASDLKTAVDLLIDNYGDVGIPSGGTTGQALEKVDGTDYNVQWATPKLSFSYTVTALIIATVADATTYYIGQYGIAPQTTADRSRMYVPVNCSIKMASIQSYAATAGSNENWSIYIRVNNTTDTLIQTIGVSANTRNWTNAALAISLTARDYFEIKIICPTWATNPAGGVFFSGNVIMQTT